MSREYRLPLQVITLPRTGVELCAIRCPSFRCPYFQDRFATYRLIVNPAPGTTDYRELMDMRFRRSGETYYRPECDDCCDCIPIRVRVANFRPSRSQRRILRRNRDVRVETGALAYADDLYEMYARYQHAVHDGMMSMDQEEFGRTFCESPVESLGMSLYLGNRRIGYGVIDAFEDALSSVYFFYDPEFRDRSPGIFSSLMEIEECRRRNLEYWYLGFYVRDCRKMEYKLQFQPHELLDSTGIWRRAET